MFRQQSSQSADLYEAARLATSSPSPIPLLQPAGALWTRYCGLEARARYQIKFKLSLIIGLVALRNGLALVKIEILRGEGRVEENKGQAGMLAYITI